MAVCSCVHDRSHGDILVCLYMMHTRWQYSNVHVMQITWQNVEVCMMEIKW
jgi:hypothetical protein